MLPEQQHLNGISIHNFQRNPVDHNGPTTPALLPTIPPTISPPSLPPGTLLKQPDIQSALESLFFNSTNLTNIPVAYQAKTLDRIIALITAAVKDPEDELGVSDFLYQRRAELASLTSPSNIVSASLTKSISIYHAPSPSPALHPHCESTKQRTSSGPAPTLAFAHGKLLCALQHTSTPTHLSFRTEQSSNSALAQASSLYSVLYPCAPEPSLQQMGTRKFSTAYVRISR